MTNEIIRIDGPAEFHRIVMETFALLPQRVRTALLRYWDTKTWGIADVRLMPRSCWGAEMGRGLCRDGGCDIWLRDDQMSQPEPLIRYILAHEFAHAWLIASDKVERVCSEEAMQREEAMVERLLLRWGFAANSRREDGVLSLSF